MHCSQFSEGRGCICGETGSQRSNGCVLNLSWGSGNDSGVGIAIDSAGSAYVTGSTDSPEFTNHGAADVFVSKFSPEGDQRIYFTILGGSGDDFGLGSPSTGRNAYVTGSTNSSNFTTASALQPNAAGTRDGFLAKLDTAGSAVSYSTFLGGLGNQSGFSVAVDNNGNAYVTGSRARATSLSLLLSIDCCGNGDAFILKVSESVLPATVQFAFAHYGVSEGSGSAIITAFRSGDISTAGTIDFATSDGTGKQNRDYILTSGTLQFATGEASKSFTLLLVDNAFIDGNRTVTLRSAFNWRRQFGESEHCNIDNFR